jgi:predicted acyltransferase
VWQLDFPYNKKIWSSSYTLLTTGLAIMVLGVLIWFIEILEIRNGLMKFFDVFGKNPLFIYVVSGIVPRLFSLIRLENGMDDKGKIKYFSPLGWFHKHVCEPISYSPELGSFLYALIFLDSVGYWPIGWIKRKSILKCKYCVRIIM